MTVVVVGSLGGCVDRSSVCVVGIGEVGFLEATARTECYTGYVGGGVSCV